MRVAGERPKCRVFGVLRRQKVSVDFNHYDIHRSSPGPNQVVGKRLVRVLGRGTIMMGFSGPYLADVAVPIGQNLVELATRGLPCSYLGHPQARTTAHGHPHRPSLSCCTC